jgi:carbamate kinase
VEKVSLNYGRQNQRFLDKLTIAECKKYLAEGQFPARSMGPKIEASVNFVNSGQDRTAVITSLELAELSLDGKAGTRISRS